MIGSWPQVLLAFVSAVIGSVALAAALEGWCSRPIGWALRVPLFASALLLIVPGLISDLSGLSIFLAVNAWCRLRKDARPAQPA